MLKLHDLKPAHGSVKRKKRVGRGCGSGSGTTSGRGNNGAQARSGHSNKLYFEGGQTPITRRLPKIGFNNINFKTRYQIVNVGDIQKVKSDAKEITTQWLYEHGLVHSKDKLVKILGNGELIKGVEVRAHAFSHSARIKIEKAKGKAEVVANA